MPQSTPLSGSAVFSRFCQIRPFSVLSVGILGELALKCRIRLVPAGASFGSDGELSAGVWVVTEGLLRLAYPPPWDDHPVFFLVWSGQLLGHLDCSARDQQAIEGVSLLDSTVVVIPKCDYLELFRDWRFSQGLAQLLWNRLCDAQRMRSVDRLPMDLRMAWTVLWLYNSLGKRIPMTRQLLGEIAGVARESAVRTLAPWEQAGWLRTRRGIIEVLKPQELRNVLPLTTLAAGFLAA